MILRDQKEEVHNRIFKHHLPYTIVDVGFWHIISFPDLPSGRTRYAQSFTLKTTIFGAGDAPDLLTHAPDIGRYVARIVKDERTLNRRVVTWADELSQNEIFDIMEELSGEKLSRDERVCFIAWCCDVAVGNWRLTVTTDVVRAAQGSDCRGAEGI